MRRLLDDLVLTAVTGVVGRGKSGIVSRCVECARAGRETCGGFAEGCLVKPRDEPPKEKQSG